MSPAPCRGGGRARLPPQTGPGGLDEGYHDAAGTWRQTSPRTRAAILASMGAGADAAAVEPAVRVLARGDTIPVTGPADIELEDGTVLPVAGTTPPDLPLGYHRLRTIPDGSETLLIVSPGSCHLPAGLRQWGWAVQLYAARSAASWGIGDLADLRRLGRWSATGLGGGVLLVNPLFSPVPLPPLQASPYSPSSRCYRDPLYLRIEEIPGAGELGPALEPLARAGRALNRERIIDRDAVFRLKQPALDLLWSRFGGHADFEAYCAAEGDALLRFATFAALTEHHRAPWPEWPEEHRRPEAPAVARFREARGERVRFHQWLQWQLEVQLARAREEIRLIHDLPVGVDPTGADAWAWQDLVAAGVTVGAPPDLLSARGQDWGLAPLVPHRLRAAGYAPFRRMLRSTLHDGGGVRIDHVMGLFRLFWIPRGRPPADGAYVRYRVDELLAILAVESQRARAVVVGEDLGTVEEGVREELARWRVLSYRLMLFEPEPPATYPELSLAAVTNHDLPTIAGLWSGADLSAQHALGLEPSVERFDEMRARLGRMAELPAEAAVPEVVVRVHQRLAEAPSVMVVATLEDALALPDRPNFPGTTGQTHPNWCRALPRTLEAIEHDDLPRSIAATFQRRRTPTG